MARSNGENGSTGAGDQATNIQTFQADGAEKIDLPSADFIAESTMTRQGGDLVLQTADGQTVTIEGYFNADPAPILRGPDGSVLTENLVESFVRSPREFAAGPSANDESPVGAVAEVKGNATVTRADGTVETIANGTPIYEGDIIQTDASGAVNIVFLDETSMAVSANARLAIDEYTFDPATESGTTNFSVLRGLFVFTSGLIGRDDPDDVKIETPVGSIGIRGTIIAGEINPGGESNISVLEGAIVIKNSAGEVTLSEQFETVRIAGFDQPLQNIGVQSASDISARFSSIGDVNPSLFSMISDSAKEQSAPSPTQEAPKIDAAPEQSSSPQASTSSSTSSNEQSHTADSTPAQSTTQAPVQTPSLSPDVFESITGALPSLDGGLSSGLPSSQIISGQPSGGLANTSPAAGTPSVSVQPPFTSTPALTDAPHTPVPAASAPETPAAPPAAIGTTPPAGSGAAALSFSGGTITDASSAGRIVGNISINAVTTSLVFSDSGSSLSGNGYYQLVANGSGGADIVLTQAGVTALSQSLDAIQLGGFDIAATLEDNSVVERTFQVLVTDANASTALNLNGPASGVAFLSNGHESGLGFSISAMGDIDNDGFDDFIVSNGMSVAGQNNLYTIMGQNAQYATGTLGAHTVAPINGSLGNFSDTVVFGIGDFNGDGILDYVVGQPNSDTGVTNSGNAFIVNGANPSQDLSFMTGGAAAEIGYSVSGVVDFNNDGHADVLIGAPGSDTAFLTLGFTTGSWTGAISPSSFVEGGTGTGFGRSVTGIGDFDGDGYSDFAVGAPTFNGTSGGVHIFRGNTNGVPSATPDLTISGNTGEGLGIEVSSIGDFNGDGLTDLIMAGDSTVSLVFGTDGAPMRNIFFHDMGGYTLLGGGGIGDFNGDGYDDFVISLGDDAGSKSYIVFGRELAADQYYEVDGLQFLKNPQNAMEINYSGANDGNELEVSGIGDINGDGFDDFAIGVPDANGAAAGNGGFAIVYGRDTGAITSPGVTTATLDNQMLVGTTGNDVFLDGSMSGTSMRGGAGNDTFRLNNTDFRNIDGGSGYDMIVLGGTGRALDFSDVDFEQISRIEAIGFGDSDQTITLSLENLFNLMKSSDRGQLYLGNINASTGLQIVLTDGNGTDDYSGTANAPAEIGTLLDSYAGGGTAMGSQTTGGTTYNTFQIGGYMLLIDNTIAVDAQ